MDRRNFLLGLAGLAGAGVAASVALSSTAEATVLGQLKDAMPPLDDMLESEELAAAGMTPDGTPIEQTQVYVVPRRRRRVRVCRTVRNRYGRRVTTCRWVWR